MIAFLSDLMVSIMSRFGPIVNDQSGTSLTGRAEERSPGNLMLIFAAGIGVSALRNKRKRSVRLGRSVICP
jgi:hypothetical protein